MSTTASPRLPASLGRLRPRRAYVVCATPRSGSTLLCELLIDSGVAGRPEEHVELLRPRGRPNEPREYFADAADRSMLDLLPVSGPPRPHPGPADERLAAVLELATTPNGVFGTKLMWGYMADLQVRLAELSGFGGLDDAARIAALLGDARFIHVRREDHVEQAVSMWRAVQTRAWRAETDDAVEPVYSFAGIDHLTHMLEAHDQAWERWFGEHRIAPFVVSYSELARDPGAALRATLEHIGVFGQFHGTLPEPSMRRQAGAQSREWAERYRREVDR